MIEGLLALAPESEIPGLLEELGEIAPVQLLRVLEKGVSVVGGKGRDVGLWAPRKVLARLMHHRDRKVRERAILLVSDPTAELETSRRSRHR